jgi:hypothetical protein
MPRVSDRAGSQVYINFVRFLLGSTRRRFRRRWFCVSFATKETAPDAQAVKKFLLKSIIITRHRHGKQIINACSAVKILITSANKFL